MPVLTLVCCLFAGTASAQSVPVTLRVSDAPLEQVLSAIEKQTTYLFVYDKNVDVARRVSIDVKDTPLNNVLNTLFQSSDIAYAVENTSIVLSQKAPAAQPGQPVTVTGKVVDASGMPVIGAAVIIKGTTIGTSTGVDGDFSLQVPPPPYDVLGIDLLHVVRQRLFRAFDTEGRNHDRVHIHRRLPERKGDVGAAAYGLCDRFVA